MGQGPVRTEKFSANKSGFTVSCVTVIHVYIQHVLSTRYLTQSNSGIHDPGSILASNTAKAMVML